MKNYKIRSRAFERNVRHWQIAKAMGITEFTLSRLLREELPPEKQEEILQIIDRIAEGGEHK